MENALLVGIGAVASVIYNSTDPIKWQLILLSNYASGGMNSGDITMMRSSSEANA